MSLPGDGEGHGSIGTLPLKQEIERGLNMNLRGEALRRLEHYGLLRLGRGREEAGA